MDVPHESVLLWCRRDLRVADHAALYHALKSGRRVHCVFVFDTAFLAGLPRRDRRVEFIHGAVLALDAQLRALGGPGCGLLVVHGDAAQELPRVAAALDVQAVFTGAALVACAGLPVHLPAVAWSRCRRKRCGGAAA